MSVPTVGMSDKQCAAFVGSNGRVNILEGSIRAGKTFSWLILLLYKVMTAGPIGSIVVVGKNRDTIFRNVFEPIETMPVFAPFAPFVHYRQGAPTARIFGRTVHCIGANDAKAEAKIRGMTVQYAFLDEVTILHVDFFKQILGRMSVPGAQLFATTNPDSPAHWLKTDYLDRLADLPDWRRFHFTIDDNPSLTDEYKRSLRAEYTGLWYRRFILGEWVSAEGAVFDMWDTETHVIPWADMPPLRDILAVGVDYGTTNATAALMLGVTNEHQPRLVLMDEWRYQAAIAEARWSDAQLSRGVRDWLDTKHTPYDTPLRPRWICLDPAAASLRVQLTQDGARGLVNADNDVLYGIRTVASLLSTGRLVVTDRCKGLITEMPGYSWDPKATEQGRDQPMKVADHSIDAARYAIATTERRWRPAVGLAA